MHYIIPPHLALDHEVTFHFDTIEYDLFHNLNSRVVLRIDEQGSHLFPCDSHLDSSIDETVKMKTYLHVGEAGIKFISAIFIVLNLTFEELIAGLTFEIDQSDCAFPGDLVAKAYVDVLLQDDAYHVLIQSPKTTIHNAEYEMLRQ